MMCSHLSMRRHQMGVVDASSACQCFDLLNLLPIQANNLNAQFLIFLADLVLRVGFNIFGTLSDNVGLETTPGRIQGGEFDAVVASNTDSEDVCDPTRFEHGTDIFGDRGDGMAIGRVCDE